MRGNPEVIGADRQAGLLEAVSDGAVGGIVRDLERENFDGAEDRFDLGRERRRVFQQTPEETTTHRRSTGD